MEILSGPGWCAVYPGAWTGFISSLKRERNISEMVIVHSMIPEKAEKLKKRLGELFPEDKIGIMKWAPA